MSGFNKPLSEPMRKAAASLRRQGMSTLVRWNWIFCAPPLVINHEQIEEGVSIIDNALSEIADYYVG
jgi:4-aminobutyrate aminotransferase-like enzyme